MTDRMASGRMPRLAHARPPQGSARGADPKALIAKVHVAKKQLALTDESYRDILQRIIGQDSSKGATAAQLDQVLQHFAGLGFTTKRSRPDHRKQIRMIEAVWENLVVYLDHVTNEYEGVEALRSFVRRQTKSPLHPAGIDDVRFLDAKDANRVLEGLKAWLAREERKAAEVVA